ncbi:MAG: protein-tyrosine phosphatase [Gaiellaceae bacterium]|nr:protein-tyrosine phosphatase [Gaiellaceae bacterium]
MIDTHCHLLAGVDDGPRTDAEALRLARKLVAEGVTTVLCTPHFSDQFPTPAVVAEERHERLRNELGLVGIELETSLAAELSDSRAHETAPDRLESRAFGGGRHLLVELVRDTTRAAIRELCRRLGSIGFVVVLAHPERCAAVQGDAGVLDEAKAAGALVQVVAPSLAGQWGDDVWSSAWRLVEEGVANLVASDAHRASATSPQLASVAALIETRCGVERRIELTELAPGRLLAPS